MPNDAGTIEILEAIQSLADQMDVRFSDADRRYASKDDLREFKDEIISHIDWFAAQHNRYDTELLALRSASMRHEERITALEESD